MQACALADIEISYEIERVRAWRFRKVSEYMRRLNKDVLFSATACRERLNELTVGEARIPTEMDDAPDERRVEMEAFRECREKLRTKEKEEKDAKENRERKAKEDLKFINAQKAEEIADKRAAEELQKADRAMTRAAQAQIRAQRAAENQAAKAQRNAQIRKQKLAAEAAKGNTDHAITAKQPANTSSNPGTITKDNTKKVTKNLATGTTKDASKNTAKETSKTATKPATKTVTKNATKDSSKVTPKVTSKAPTKDTTDSVPDPRTCISFPDLQKLCADRGLDISNKDTAKMIQALQHSDEEWSLNDLKKMARLKGVSCKGTKAHLRHRLALAAATSYASYEAGGVGAADSDDSIMEEE